MNKLWGRSVWFTAALVAGVLAVVSAGVLGPPPAAAIDLLIPHERFDVFAEYEPKPVSENKRVPIRLRLANAIHTDDGSHLKPAKEVTFVIDRHFRLDLSGVPRCPFAPLQAYPRFDWSRCEKATVGVGGIKWEVAHPEEETFRTAATLTAYRRNAQQLILRGVLPAPLAAEVVIPIAVRRTTLGHDGASFAAVIPQLSGGDASLVYLGLTFRKGLFSATCPDRGLQFRFVTDLVDSGKFTSTLLKPC